MGSYGRQCFHSLIVATFVMLSFQSIRSLLIIITISLCVSPTVASALDLTGRIQFNEVCPLYENIRGAKVILNSGQYSAYVNKHGQFAIPNVEDGIYVLSVLSHDYVFDQLRVDVTKSDPPISVYAFIPGTPLSNNTVVSLPNPILLTPRAKNAYFAQREGFNPLEMLKSPMMLLMIGTGALLFLTPYLMSHMDKDALDEVRDKQGKMLAAQSSLANMDIGGGLANLLGTNSENNNKATSQASSTPAKSKSKPKRR